VSVSILYVPIAAYLLFGVFLFVMQNSFIYFATPPIQHSHKTEVFKSDGESIHVSILNPQKESAIIYFGGNAEIVEYNSESFLEMFENHTIYLVNYRGYGKSTGRPNQVALYYDALHIYDEIKQRHQSISLIGRSLGSAVATYVASKREVDRLVLVTPFDSIKSVAQRKILFYPMFILLREKHDSASRVPYIEADTLVVVAQNDEIIGRRHSDNLISKFPKNQLVVEIIEGAGHNNISKFESYRRVLRDFINTGQSF